MTRNVPRKEAAAMSVGYRSAYAWVCGVAQAWLLQLPIATRLNKTAVGFPCVSVKRREYQENGTQSDRNIFQKANTPDGAY
jgi:hypothetical protein